MQCIKRIYFLFFIFINSINIYAADSIIMKETQTITIQPGSPQVVTPIGTIEIKIETGAQAIVRYSSEEKNMSISAVNGALTMILGDLTFIIPNNVTVMIERVNDRLKITGMGIIGPDGTIIPDDGYEVINPLERLDQTVDAVIQEEISDDISPSRL